MLVLAPADYPQRILTAFASEVTTAITATDAIDSETLLRGPYKEPLLHHSITKAASPWILHLPWGMHPRAMVIPHVPATRPQLDSHCMYDHAPYAGFIATPHAPVPQTPEPLTVHGIPCTIPWRSYCSMHICAVHPGFMATLEFLAPQKLEHSFSGCSSPL